MLISPISASLSPNTEKEDVREAVKVMFRPWIWKQGSAQKKVTEWFINYLNLKEAPVFFDSGRSALLAILKAFNIGRGDEVIVQAFTCAAVANSVIWAGAKPIYADIDNNFNLDPKALEKKISKQTNAIIVQHTFGAAANLEALLSVAKKYQLFVIEDCAHALGATYKGRKLGTLGDAAFFSFGRDKVVSSVWGGAAIISLKFEVQGAKLKKFEKSLSYPPHYWIFQQLLHPIAFSFILMSYNIYLGKIVLFLLQRIRLLSLPMRREEYTCRKPSGFPAKYPNALSLLLLRQLNKLERYNTIRQQTAREYSTALKQYRDIKSQTFNSESIYLRFPILVAKPLSYLRYARCYGIILGNWYHNLIDPTGVNLNKLGYKKGSCPQAEKMASQILNLPTLLNQNQMNSVIKTICNLYANS